MFLTSFVLERIEYEKLLESVSEAGIKSSWLPTFKRIGGD